MNNTLQIKISYDELRVILIDVYKQAVGSYEDLAEVKINEILNDVVSKKYMSKIDCVNFEINKEKKENTNTPESFSSAIFSSTPNYTAYTYSGETTIITSDQSDFYFTSNVR
jgi:hypothetical protein